MNSEQLQKANQLTEKIKEFINFKEVVKSALDKEDNAGIYIKIFGKKENGSYKDYFLNADSKGAPNEISDFSSSLMTGHLHCLLSKTEELIQIAQKEFDQL